MKIVDANVLLYAVNADSAHHNRARRWLLKSLTGNEAIGFPWVSLLAFVRVSTNPRIFASPPSISAAFDLVDSWLGQPPSTVPAPTARHAALLQGLLEQTGAAGNLTTDAHLAALSIEHSADVGHIRSGHREVCGSRPRSGIADNRGQRPTAPP